MAKKSAPPKKAAKKASKPSKSKSKSKAASGGLGNAIAGPSNQRQNISIRKIDNGYVTSTSSYGKDGQYRERETFTKAKPKIVIGDRGSSNA